MTRRLGFVDSDPAVIRKVMGGNHLGSVNIARAAASD